MHLTTESAEYKKCHKVKSNGKQQSEKRIYNIHGR